MPQELPSTSSTGHDSTDFGTAHGSGVEPVIEWGAIQGTLGVEEDTPQSQTDESRNADVRINDPLPRSVALARTPNAAALVGRGSILQTRQLWEGTVIEAGEKEFVAKLTDITCPQNPDEQVSIDYEEVSEDDRQLVSPGSSFYLILGSEQTPAGQRKNVSIIQFRRLPNWTRAAVAMGTDRARRIREIFRS